MEREMADEIKSIYLGPSSLRTALGDRKATLKAILANRTGLGYNAQLAMPLGRLVDEETAMEGESRIVSLIVRRVEEVLHEARLEGDDPSWQLILSTTKGNIEALQGVKDTISEEAFLHHTAERVQELIGAVRSPIVISNACISGLSALIVARRLMKEGVCRHAVVVGADLVGEFIATGFASFKSLSEEPCRPYDAARDGLTLGEAVAALLLTTDEALADEGMVRLDGGAVTNDANHISGPSRTGDGLYYAMTQALEEAGLEAEAVGLVNTHGTATLYNDEMESKALFLAGLDQTPTNSLKGYIGHTLGASGVVETILTADQLRAGVAFATKGFSTLGVPCEVRVSDRIQPLEKRVAVKTASGFGGCNAALVLSMERTEEQPLRPTVDVKETAAYTLPQSERPFAEFIREEYRALGEEKNMKFYKMSDLSKGLYVAVENLLKGHELQPRYTSTEVAVVLANSSSSLEADREHQRLVDQHPTEGTSPAVFVYTLPNVAMGEVCIRHKIQGDNTFFIEREGAVVAECYARILLETGRARAVITGLAEKLDEKWQFELKLLETK